MNGFSRQTCVAIVLAASMLLPSCGPQTASTKGNTPNVTGGIGKQLPAVGRHAVMNDLRQLGVAYPQYVATAGQGPAKLADWTELKADAPKVYEAIEDGRYVVIWGVRLLAVANDAGLSNTILAYEKDAPNQGGGVLMADGSVKTMTAPEFQAAPKAKGK